MRKATRMALALASASLSISSTVLAQPEPNIIFILMDDMGVESIEGDFWSNEMGCKTPTLAAMAAQGVSFTNCRVNPNCSPTRAALMTGRNACETGVNGVLGRYVSLINEPMNPCDDAVPLSGDEAKVTNRLGLQTHERTIAEVLHDAGYYTVLADKWHLGYNEGNEDVGLLPVQQGFDLFFDWQGDVTAVPRICDDDFYADRHISETIGLAVTAVTNRPNQEQPYALFFHSTTPHRRHNDTGGHMWWAIERPSLIPQTYSLAPSNTNRFLQNVEAFDSLLFQELLGPDGLQVLDANKVYDPETNTIIFFIADNGTDGAVSYFGTGRAKNSVFEGGIKVPMFVMGEGISGTSYADTEDTRLVNHVDFYDTLCDVIGADSSARNNAAYGRFPRRSISFADGIGWGSPVQPREFSLSSYGDRAPVTHAHIWKAILVWNDYKLACNSGSENFDDMKADQFVDLALDPGESVNLLPNEMTVDQLTAYYYMRDRIVDEWPTAVCTADAVPVPAHYTVDHFYDDDYVLVAHIVDGEIDDQLEEFYNLQVDPNRTVNLVQSQMTTTEEAVYDLLHSEFQQLFLEGGAAPDVSWYDVDLASTLVTTSENQISTGPLTIGHENVENYNGDELEYRARLKFNVTSQLEPPLGFEWSDLLDAQIIVGFKHDSVQWDTSGYFDNDTDTGVITIHQMTAWTNNLWDENYHIASVELGLVDLPPHIIPNPPTDRIRAVPMKVGCPVSFGHNTSLKNLVLDWISGTQSNHGVMLKAQRLGGTTPDVLPGDQHVHFLREAKLRLTFQRQ